MLKIILPRYIWCDGLFTLQWHCSWSCGRGDRRDWSTIGIWSTLRRSNNSYSFGQSMRPSAPTARWTASHRCLCAHEILTYYMILVCTSSTRLYSADIQHARTRNDYRLQYLLCCSGWAGCSHSLGNFMDYKYGFTGLTVLKMPIVFQWLEIGSDRHRLVECTVAQCNLFWPHV